MQEDKKLFCQSVESYVQKEGIPKLEEQLKDKMSFLNRDPFRQVCCFCETTFSTVWSRNRHLLKPCSQIKFLKDQNAQDEFVVPSQSVAIPGLSVPTFIRRYHPDWKPGDILNDQVVNDLHIKGDKSTERQELLSFYLTYDPDLKDYKATMLDLESITALDAKLRSADSSGGCNIVCDADLKFIEEYDLWIKKQGGKKGCGVSDTTRRQYKGYLFNYGCSFRQMLKDEGTTLTSLQWNSEGTGRIQGKSWTQDIDLPGVSQGRACAYQSLLNFLEFKFEEAEIPPGDSILFNMHAQYGNRLLREKKLVTSIIKEMKSRSETSTKARKLLRETTNPGTVGH